MQVLDRPITGTTAVPAFSPQRFPSTEVTADEARAELARVIGSPDFPATPRNRRFLAYTVDRYFENRTGEARVTAWDIAVRVFGRPENFNPILDPIVRIEAGKLRRDLETYYLKAGRANPLRIDLPRGGYDPAFTRSLPEAATPSVHPPVATGRLVEDAAAELARISESRDFPATPRNRKFLAYVVENELHGALQEITAGHIGRRIFGRGANFDPNTDPIVRIEAARLRRDLETYYLKSGRYNPLRISLPKGGYRPAFAYQNT